MSLSTPPETQWADLGPDERIIVGKVTLHRQRVTGETISDCRQYGLRTYEKAVAEAEPLGLGATWVLGRLEDALDDLVTRAQRPDLSDAQLVRAKAASARQEGTHVTGVRVAADA